MDPHATKFLWTGMRWNAAILLGRLTWVGVAFGLALLAAFFFDRFDPERAGGLPVRKQGRGRSLVGAGMAPSHPVDRTERPAHGSQRLTGYLTGLSRSGSLARPRTRLLGLVIAELRLLIRGHGWWWYVGAAGLFIGCLASPLDTARSGVILAAWIWPVLAWSQMGSREERYATGSLIFSSPRAVPRQLLASYLAGVLLAALTGGGLALHLLFAGEFTGLGAWAAGAFFIPALALALGVTTGTRKAFEAIYTGWWYVGPLHHIPGADFMGTTAQSSSPVRFLMAAGMLMLIAYAWRRGKLAYA
jgi:hypothetical protein